MDHSSISSNSSEDEDQAMVRHGANRGRTMPKRLEIDLSSVLSEAQQQQLNRLINGAADEIQKHILLNLDLLTPAQVAPNEGIQPPKVTCTLIPNPNSQKYRDKYIDTDQAQTDGPQPQRDNVKPAHQHGKHLDPPKWRLPNSPEEALEIYGKTEKDILIQSVEETKREILTHFAKWRHIVQRRMMDIVIKNGGTSGNVTNEEQPPAGNFRNVGRRPDAAIGRPSLPSAVLTPAEIVSNATLARLHTATYTPLRETPKEKRALILHCVMLVLLGVDQYTTYARILLVKLASSLNIPMHVLLLDESRVGQALAGIIKGIAPEEVVQKRSEQSKTSRRWRPNTVMTTGDSIPLAPSLVVAGIGTVFGGLGLHPTITATILGAMNDNTVTVGTMFGLYGARQGSKTVEAHGKDVQNFGILPLHGVDKSNFIDPKDVRTEDRRMRVTFGVSGVYTAQDDIIESWQILGQQTEAYVIRWDTETLTKMGTALDTLFKSPAWYAAKKEITSDTVFDRLNRSIWPAPLVKVSKTIDNPWCIGMVRAEKMGGILADIIHNRLYGERPITLIGYGLGARAIYACLMSLAEKKSYASIENAIIIGAPCPAEVRVWAAMKSVVLGRLVNVFSQTDYILGFLYRSGSWQYGVAGLQCIQGVPDVENLNITEKVSNHLSYRYLVGHILQKLGLEDIDYAEIDKEDVKLRVQMDKEIKIDQEREERSKVTPTSSVQKGSMAKKDTVVGRMGKKMKGANLGRQ